jgi:hypothetical protein
MTPIVSIDSPELLSHTTERPGDDDDCERKQQQPFFHTMPEV